MTKKKQYKRIILLTELMLTAFAILLSSWIIIEVYILIHILSLDFGSKLVLIFSLLSFAFALVILFSRLIVGGHKFIEMLKEVEVSE
jgi:hypothetical protein